MNQEHSPVLFNALKHHLGYLKILIHHIDPFLPPNELRRLLLPIGAAQLDFYTGPLSVDAIVAEVKKGLQEQGLLTFNSYTSWIQMHSGYRMISLTDSSQWVLRLGHQSDQWVHLHPARYSPYTLRVMAHTLKTALALAILYPGYSIASQTQLSLVNSVRTYLQLPPLAPGQFRKGLEQLLVLL